MLTMKEQRIFPQIFAQKLAVFFGGIFSDVQMFVQKYSVFLAPCKFPQKWKKLGKLPLPLAVKSVPMNKFALLLLSSVFFSPNSKVSITDSVSDQE